VWIYKSFTNNEIKSTPTYTAEAVFMEMRNSYSMSVTISDGKGQLGRPVYIG